jgi:hypothetical protein
MQPLEFFETVGTRGYFRPSGIYSLDEAVALVDAAIVRARAERVRQLLANLLDIDGIPIPTIIERFLYADDWANLAGGLLQLAVVARPELIDRNKFGVLVAANRGLLADVFTSEAEAVAWLDKVADRKRSGQGPRPT